MFRPPASSSRTLRDLSGDLSPDQSTCSSDTGNVLIRSTGAPLSDWSHEAGPGPESVKITVQKLRNRVPVQPPAEQQRPEPTRKPSTGAAPRSATDGVPDRRRLKEPGQTEENREPTLPPAAEWSPDRKLPAGTQSERQPGHDLLTSRFTAGGRGVVLAALRQRSRSAPHRREIQVKLLDPVPLQTSSQDAAGVARVQMEAQSQSHMEARVCQLVDSVQRLLQADREGGDRGQSLSQQTLQHLETLHSQQLQLQGQLLDSALRIVTGHTPTDLTASDQPTHLQVTHLDSAGNVLSDQKHSSSATKATVETGPVTVATPNHDRWPERTRGDCYHPGAPAISMKTQSPEGTRLQSSANHRQATARGTNEVLREMERLKTEMKMLLKQPESSVDTTRPPLDQHQAQQPLPQSEQNQAQLQQPQFHQNQSQPNHFHSQQNQNQSQQLWPLQNPTQSQSSSVLLQRRPEVPSMLEEAGEVLYQVRRQKKVLEENLEALLRTTNGEVLHCQLEALVANRDWTEEVRIKKTVDAWISTSSRDVQATMPSEDAAGSITHSRRGRPVSTLRRAGSQMAAGEGGRGPRVRHRAVQGAEPGTIPGVLMDSEQVEGELYLAHLYGRAPYEGLRRTLKKSPYLRFSSPVSPPSRKPRPRLVESVRGVKVKSCKTQTSVAPPPSPSPGQPHHHVTLSSAHMASGDPADLTKTPAGTLCVPMAIPLGRRRTDSRCLTELWQEVTSPPAPPPHSSVVVVVGGATEQQSQREEQLDEDEAPLPSSLFVIEMKSEEEEDKENVFPGADFLSVADVVQDQVSVVGEEAVELDGGVAPLPVQYQGPVFPPHTLPALPTQGQASILDTNQQRDTLENRLVEWVEQELMSRMISEMYHPPPSDPTHNISSDQSELEERRVPSDIVEAAGGGGLQLFVDSSVLVDSGLIRQLVQEALTEIVALMLAQREVQDTGPEPGMEPPEPGLSTHQEDKLVPPIPTPVPTPPPIMTTPSEQTTPPITPTPSEPTSLLHEESPQPITAPALVTTPTPSPDPTPSTGSPSAPHQVPPPLTWGDTELPLEEERPEEQLDTYKHLLVMSVAEEEPPLSPPFPLPPSSLPPAPSLSPPDSDPDPRPASPSSCSGDSSSSSSAVTAALKHISEGELLISINQLAAMTEEEAGCSLSSSLQELQDMDHDPPSEGQLTGHNLLLALLTKMEQGVTHRGERPQPEGSWGREDPDQEEEVSAGEVRDDGTTRPLSTAARQGQTSSPGQISQCADVLGVSFEAANQGSVNMGNLMMEPQGTLTSDLQIDLSLSPPPHLKNIHTAGQVIPTLVKQTAKHKEEEEEEEEEGRSRKMNVQLPLIRPEEGEEGEEGEVSAAADTDSSTNDVF